MAHSVFQAQLRALAASQRTAINLLASTAPKLEAR